MTDFKYRCCGKGATITIIKSEYELLFGGYTSLSWRDGHEYETDLNDPFIFSLNKKSQHFNYTKDNSIFVYSTYGFGNGDICISNNSNLNSDSYSSLGSGYDAPKGQAKGSKKAKSYLAGSHKFRVLEVEIYSIKFN